MKEGDRERERCRQTDRQTYTLKEIWTERDFGIVCVWKRETVEYRWRDIQRNMDREYGWVRERHR